MPAMFRMKLLSALCFFGAASALDKVRCKNDAY